MSKKIFYDNIINSISKINEAKIEDYFKNEILPLKPQDKIKFKKNIAFLYDVLQNILQIDDENIFDYIVDGGQDGGIDAIYYDDNVNIYIFQTKYYDHDGGISIEAINKIINTKNSLINLSRELNKQSYNTKLFNIMEEIRDRMNEIVYTPKITIYLCNNGQKWGNEAQDIIDNDSSQYINWKYLNHDDLIDYHNQKPPIGKILINLSGSWINEKIEFKEILIGKITIKEIFSLVEKYGNNLLNENVRFFLGIDKSDVNKGLVNTLQNEPKNFYYYNNGITILCENLSCNSLKETNITIELDKMQIINGGQTCNTIYHLYKPNPQQIPDGYVLVKIIKSDNKNNFYHHVAKASNTQNPVTYSDLSSNDEIQINLEKQIKLRGMNYKIKRDSHKTDNNDISPAILAEAVLVVLKQKFKEAKYGRNKHFTKYYDDIFKDLTAEQAIISVKLFRYAEKERRKANEDKIAYYGSYMIATTMYNLINLELKQDFVNNINYNNYILYTENGKISDLYSNTHNFIKDSLIEKYGNDWHNLSNRDLRTTLTDFEFFKILRKKIFR